MAVVQKMKMVSAEAVESSDDLLIEILSKLPLRSLARFKFVSRRWHSIIVNWVRNPNPTPAAAVGLFHASGFHTYKFIPLDWKTKKDPPFKRKLPFHDDPSWPIWIQQSCNGLLLCCSSCEVDKPGNWHSDYPIRRIYVYNPTTKDLARLPMPVQTRIITVNLAFDPSMSPFYKAVCLRESELGPRLVQVEVYSFESNAWRPSGEPYDGVSTTISEFSQGVYWNSSVLWIDYRTREIRYFNVEDERLRSIPLPAAMNNLKLNPTRRCYFGESCGHLHMIPVTPRSLDVYEMKKDYSGWFIKYKVPTTKFYRGIGMFKGILTLTRGHDEQGSFLFILLRDRVVRFNLATKTSKTIFRYEDELEFKMVSFRLQRLQYIESVARVI